MSNLVKRCLWGVYFLILLLPTTIQAHTPQQEPVDQEIDATDVLEPEVLSNYAALTINWGIASLLQAPKNMDFIFWRSRLLGATLYYNIPVRNSHFMVSCGADLYNVDYLFKEGEYTIDRDASTRKTIVLPTSKVVPTFKKAEKSSLSIWHADFVSELRFNSNKEEPQEGFFIAIGGNIGFQFSPAVTIQYKEDKENKTQTIQESFNLSKLRYGVLTRMGWGRFGAFYQQTLSGFFNDQGPTTSTNKSILPFSVGVSVNLL